MQIIEQSHQFLPFGTLESIELAGRTAYKSEDKITPSSAEKFVADIIKRGHESVLEHYPLRYRIRNRCPDAILGDVREILEETIGMHHSITPDWIYISMNARTLRDAKRLVNNELTNLLLVYARQVEPRLYLDLGENELTPQLATCGLDIPTEKQIMANLSSHEAMKHIYRMVKFITNRGVTHEIVRHRPPTYTQESTRYCNYAKKGVAFIKPVFFEPGPKFEIWRNTNLSLEQIYNRLIAMGCTPQEARDVLDNALKTEIVVTTHIREWHYMMTLRTALTAHPQMQALMKPTLVDFQGTLPQYFCDIPISTN